MNCLQKNLWFVFVLLTFWSCNRDELESGESGSGFHPIHVNPNAPLPGHLPRMDVPKDNPSTQEGIALGRKLFYEPMLSGDGTQKCASCHNQGDGFTDNGLAFSKGIDNIEGTRNSMPLFNLGLRHSFFWDGRATSLELQAIEPVLNPIEMHETWARAVAKLNQIPVYRNLAYRAFGKANLDSINASKAIAQFERSLVSVNSKYDRWRMDPKNNPLTPSEARGLLLFNRDRNPGQPGADCFHCHVPENDFTDNLFHNNGLDQVFHDAGRSEVTKDPYDQGKFKTPSLRNLAFTAPYMHDGRFKTLEEVIKFYSEELQFSPTIDVLMKNQSIGGVHLDSMDQIALRDFLLTLTDTSFINNPDYSSPQ